MRFASSNQAEVNRFYQDGKFLNTSRYIWSCESRVWDFYTVDPESGIFKLVNEHKAWKVRTLNEISADDWPQSFQTVSYLMLSGVFVSRKGSARRSVHLIISLLVRQTTTTRCSKMAWLEPFWLGDIGLMDSYSRLVQTRISL